MTNELSSEQLLASAVVYLGQGDEQERELAEVLVSCNINAWVDWERNSYGTEYVVDLTGPRVAFDWLHNYSHYERARTTFEAVLPQPNTLADLTIRVELTPLGSSWRQEVLAGLRGHKALNQGGIAVAPSKPPRVWQNLKFNSATEVMIARALDRRCDVLAELRRPPLHP